MITRIEVDGFKTLRRAWLDLEPFQAIIGPNDIGKSNLLDALMLLSRLAEGDLSTATAGGRGGAADIFTWGPDGRQGERALLAVEMLVEPTVEDAWGRSSEIRYTRLRYEIEVARREDQGRLAVTHEALLPIQRSDDPWGRRSIGRGRERWLPALRTGRTVPFISTSHGYGRASTVLLHQDGRGGGMVTAAHDAERSVLSTIANTEFPHAFAAREELRSWKSLRLVPEAIIRNGRAAPSSGAIGADGGNLGGTLTRMDWAEPGSVARVGADLARVIPSIQGLAIEEESGRRVTRLVAIGRDGRRQPISTLSGGAVRALVLAALAHDPDTRGVICLDEPEAGLDPATLRRLIPLLLSIPTDLNVTDTRPLRQVIVASASSTLLQELVRQLSSKSEDPIHELRQVLIALCDNEAMTSFHPLRPSQQLELPLDIGADEGTITLADAVRTLSTEGLAAGRA